MKRVCRECGAAVPPGHPACPLCGKPVPTDDAAPAAAPDFAAMGREAAAERRTAARAGVILRAIEALLFVVAIPVLLPGLLVLGLMVKRTGRVPVSLVIGEGVLLTGLSYLSFEMGDGPLAGVVFPLMLASCGAVAVLFVLRASRGGMDGGILLGYSAVVSLLMVAGGLLFCVGGGLILHRLRAPRFLKVVSDVPLKLDPAQAVARKELLVNLELVDARLDTARAGWRVVDGGADVFCAAGAEDEDPAEASAADLFKKAPEWLGRRVALQDSYTSGVGHTIPEDWQAFIMTGIRKGGARYWMPVGGRPLEKIYLVSALLEEDDGRAAKDVLDLDAPVGILAEIPTALLEDSNGLGQRGRQRGDAKGLALLAEAAPRRYCAPLLGTSGALWIEADGEEPPSEELHGVMEWPEGGAGRSLAALARRACGAEAGVRPRVLVLGPAAAYRNARGIAAEAAEGIPLHHWGSLGLGALLLAVAVVFALFE